MSQTLGNIVSEMGLGGTSPPFVTNGYGAWLRTRGTGFESDQIQVKQKVTIPEQTEAAISEPLDRSPQAKQGSLPKAGAERSGLAGSAREECHKHSGIIPELETMTVSKMGLGGTSPPFVTHAALP